MKHLQCSILSLRLLRYDKLDNAFVWFCFAFQIYARLHLKFLEVSTEFCQTIRLTLAYAARDTNFSVFATPVTLLQRAIRKDKDVEKCRIDPDFLLTKRECVTRV